MDIPRQTIYITQFGFYSLYYSTGWNIGKIPWVKISWPSIFG
jgi:hypothetical protein